MAHASLAAFSAALLALAPAANAAPVALTIVNKTGSSEKVYITFNNNPSSSAYNISYVNTKGQPVVVDRQNGFSESIDLSTVKGAQFNVTSLVSGGMYISFGEPLSKAAPSPFTTNFRFVQVEFTIFNPGNSSNNGDFTGVNLFSASLEADNQGGPGTVGFGSTSTASIFKDLYSALKSTGQLGSGNNSSVITQGGDFVRVLSPTNWGYNPTAGTYSVGPYNSFEPYVKELYNNGKPQVTNIQTVIQTGSSIFNGTSYSNGLRYVCNFQATPVASGKNYSFTLSGEIDVYTLPTTSNQQPLATLTNLTAALPFDTSGNPELSFMIYAQPFPFTNNTRLNQSNWTASGLSSADANLLAQTVLGDLQEGMLTGLVGSNVTLTAKNCSNSNLFGKQLKNVSSNYWWSAYTGSLYETLQPNSNPPNYSVYSSVVFPAGNTYSAPYDDRFQSHNPDIPVNNGWTITLNPTGNLSVSGGSNNNNKGGGNNAAIVNAAKRQLESVQKNIKRWKKRPKSEKRTQYLHDLNFLAQVLQRQIRYPGESGLPRYIRMIDAAIRVKNLERQKEKIDRLRKQYTKYIHNQR